MRTRSVVDLRSDEADGTADAGSPAPGNAAVRVLLVDDDPFRLVNTVAMLEGMEVSCVVAASEHEAHERLAEGDYAALVLATRDAAATGLRIAAAVHAHPEHAALPVLLVLDGGLTALDWIDSGPGGPLDCISRPLVPDVLRGKVEILAELHRLRRSSTPAANASLDATSPRPDRRADELDRVNRMLERTNAELTASNAALLREVAVRRRAEAALKWADERKDGFLAALSHELRNPLAAITNAVRLLQIVPRSDPRAGASLDLLGRQVSVLARLLDDLLDISRIRTGRIVLRRQRIDLNGLLDPAAESAGLAQAGAPQRLELVPAPAPLMVDGDPVRLVQVLANLLAHASASAAPDACIRIEMAAAAVTGGDASPEAVVTLRTDPPVPSGADVATLLRDDAALDADAAALGASIGLALSRELVKLHGGKLDPGPAPDANVVLSLRMPLAVPSESAPIAPPPVGRTAANGVRTHRILVVDDNHDAVESLATLLGLLGHEVRQAYDGRTAIELAGRFQPDLILLDLGMPGMSGYDVARELREHPWGRGTTLIALTGYGSADDRKASHDAGFDGHLVKPIDFDALQRTLDDHGAASRLHPQPG